MVGRHKQHITQETPRLLAVRCLVAWDREGKAIQPHVDAVVHRSDLGSRDRQLAVKLIQGVLRRLQELDHAIGLTSRFPLADMKPLTLMTLRVGAFQLLFLDRIPASAAVNETVKVLRRERQPVWLVRFVNGVLRTISRRKDTLLNGDGSGNDEIMNHPDWLVNRWRARFGREKTRAVCRANNREPALTLRVNTCRTTARELARELALYGCTVRPGLYAPGALVLENMTGALTALPGYEDGLFHVQDEAAQLVTLLLGPLADGARWLDCCAGLGGKTCHLAQLLPPGAGLTAVEPSPYRCRLLAQNLERLRLADLVERFQGDLDAFAASSPGCFDRILVDAPCSGTGVIGRHPDIRWNRQLRDLQHYRQKQLSLLAGAASLAAPGGILVYATCSMEQEENQQVVEQFLRKHKNFRLSHGAAYLPESAVGLVDNNGCFSSNPSDGLDGFFGARLQRSG